MSLLNDNRWPAPAFAWTRDQYYARQAKLDELRASQVSDRPTPEIESFRGERLPTLEDLIRPPIWWAFALCRGQGTDAWFPDRGVDTREVKALCARCPAREACAADAAMTGTRHGIWGGLSAQQRRKVRRGLTVELDEAC